MGSEKGIYVEQALPDQRFSVAVATSSAYEILLAQLRTSQHKEPVNSNSDLQHLRPRLGRDPGGGIVERLQLAALVGVPPR